MMFMSLMQGGQGDFDLELRWGGPFESFEDAANACASSPHQVIVEWSRVYGWLSIWERSGDRAQLIVESSAAGLLRMKHRSEAGDPTYCDRPPLRQGPLTQQTSPANRSETSE